ncbi:MAG: hypothetical protein COY38_04355 [Candidatus Aenigmarchaeota archaeon CG_4_10_14_0_8_um_filter_37_24]|nr:hypothetical protein [Candidatus Aenigmarchaeota archaeon]OIN87903.1 MAG: hypothetical protein AUJ50_02220 [Candidatus Aenigmarchaeota archaeon CG1_02_38_14]PIV68596.1 MAG: hypothetical protein COS07_03625 [Candidatus Aenigmarchaeota archaeon CG01_land_8_20_14_3_00_37_9]PIW41600.1 MAG: hypothetical protein COW21_01085 [Candidatus Aenigmarchaeota archaeon CG15_BIG_FIL_POST_REV_8_21_14_020_37_27]PIX51194.1 MAG: hypothetical protein COZ52_00160 [Candidatus Aenigmarchaeota archaeon CG_4_8_14_3_u
MRERLDELDIPLDSNHFGIVARFYSGIKKDLIKENVEVFHNGKWVRICDLGILEGVYTKREYQSKGTRLNRDRKERAKKRREQIFQLPIDPLLGYDLSPKEEELYRQLLNTEETVYIRQIRDLGFQNAFYKLQELGLVDFNITDGSVYLTHLESV